MDRSSATYCCMGYFILELLRIYIVLLWLDFSTQSLRSSSRKSPCLLTIIFVFYKILRKSKTKSSSLSGAIAESKGLVWTIAILDMMLSRNSSYLYSKPPTRFLHYRKQSFLPVEKVFVHLLDCRYLKRAERKNIKQRDFLDWSEPCGRNGEV